MIAVINEIPISFAEIFYVDFDLSIFLEINIAQNGKAEVENVFQD